MSKDKDNIRDMVMALSQGDHDAANLASAEVMASKTAKVTAAVSEEVDAVVPEGADSDEASDDDGEELDEGSPMLRASRRHARAGRRHMEVKRDIGRQRPTTEMGNDDMTYEMGRREAYEMGKHKAYNEMGKNYKVREVSMEDSDGMDHPDYEMDECGCEDPSEVGRYRAYEMGKNKAYTKMGKHYGMRDHGKR